MTDIATVIRGAADSLEQMADGATPGPWKVARHGVEPAVVEPLGLAMWNHAADARLIAAMSPDLARALAVQMRATVERHQQEPHDARYCDCCHQKWPCPDVLAWSPIAEHITQTQGGQ